MSVNKQEIKKAIPTEYRGVRFDSKSEAVFARMLDLSGIPWEKTHPILHDGHSWDFLVWTKETNWAGFCENGYRDGDPVEGDVKSFECPEFNYSPVLIELKPSMPTSTYMQNISRRSDDRLCCESRIVVWGNPFSDDLQDIGGWKELYLAIELRQNDGKELYYRSASEVLPLSCLLRGFNSRCVHDARKFRFDLS